MGVRVFKLAKELDMSSKELMTYLRTQGHQVTNHMCTLEDTVAQILRDRLPKKAKTKKAQEKKEDKKEKVKAGAVKTGANGGAGDEAASAGSGTERRAPRKTAAPAATAGRGGKAGGDDTAAKDDRPRDKGARPPARKRFFPGAGDYGPPGRGIHGGRGRVGRSRGKAGDRGGGTSVQSLPSEGTVQMPITLKSLSSEIGLRATEIIKSLMLKKGLMLTVNSYLDQEHLLHIGEDFGIKITVEKEKTVEDAIQAIEDLESAEEQLERRAPVVTFLGHVDHGKTSLLDYIRKTKVTAKEHGGITQHLGAYRVDSGNVHVVFIDTPGHKAFTEMRARGANVTDVAVLVVAADEGPMPQTEEAYNHAVAAGVPIVVALNKMDKPGANPTKAMESLSKLGLQPVQWGGKTEIVEVSALSGAGIDNLLETLSLESEILELKADPKRDAIGVVLEAELNPGRGNLATVLIQDGTLRLGDDILCGRAYGRVRSMLLNSLQPVEEAGPSTPVQISGLAELPEVGAKLYGFKDAAQARQIADDRQRRFREEERATAQHLSLQNIWDQLQGDVKELNLVLKADVRGTLEALKRSLADAGNEEVEVKILHSGVGAISQDDVLLADASRGIILGFNVNLDDRGKTVADEKQIEIRTYNVIYELLDDVKRAIEDRLSPELSEESQGRVEVLQVFHASKIGKIAGCMVRKGKIQRDSKLRVVRDGNVIHSGTLSSLKRFKDDVKEVKEGFECGLKIAGYDAIEPGDFVEAYTIVEKRRSL